MKAIYLEPTTEVISLSAEPLLLNVSGSGLNDGGEDDGTHSAHAPRRTPVF